MNVRCKSFKKWSKILLPVHDSVFHVHWCIEGIIMDFTVDKLEEFNLSHTIINRQVQKHPISDLKNWPKIGKQKQKNI